PGSPVVDPRSRRSAARRSFGVYGRPGNRFRRDRYPRGSSRVRATTDERRSMTLLLLPLIASLATGDSLPLPRSLPPPAAAVGAEGAVVVVHRQPAVPLVSLRMAILADDP